MTLASIGTVIVAIVGYGLSILIVIGAFSRLRKRDNSVFVCGIAWAISLTVLTRWLVS